jgi:hypothetical protein
VAKNVVGLNPIAKFIAPDWGDTVDSGIELIVTAQVKKADNPMSESTA